MKISGKEYNRRFKAKGYGFVVRSFWDKWAVCDGLAPDTDDLVEETSIFLGYVVKYLPSFEEADSLRNMLNA